MDTLDIGLFSTAPYGFYMPINTRSPVITWDSRGVNISKNGF
jgi:hypothetical protein